MIVNAGIIHYYSWTLPEGVVLDEADYFHPDLKKPGRWWTAYSTLYWLDTDGIEQSVEGVEGGSSKDIEKDTIEMETD